MPNVLFERMAMAAFYDPSEQTMPSGKESNANLQVAKVMTRIIVLLCCFGAAKKKKRIKNKTNGSLLRRKSL